MIAARLSDPDRAGIADDLGLAFVGRLAAHYRSVISTPSPALSLYFFTHLLQRDPRADRNSAAASSP